MEPHSLAHDLLLVDLADPAALTELVVTYSLAPCRRMFGMPAPRRNEDRDWFKGWRASDAPEQSPAHFEPVIIGLALYAGLFPYGTPTFTDRRTISHAPNFAFIDGAYTMAIWTDWHEIERQVGGLFSEPDSDGPNFIGHKPWPNPEAMAELAAMKSLLARLAGPPSKWGDFGFFEETGLERVDIPAALDLDEILHRDVHRRLVWFGTADPILPEETPGDEGATATWDGGIFPASIPESISGAIALDYTDGLALHRRMGVCGHCQKAVVLSNQQAARARKGLAIYHDECASEHRLGYFRDYQRRRASAPTRDSQETAGSRR